MVKKRDGKSQRSERLPARGATGSDRLPVFALLDNVRSVWNVGSMFRTADAAGLAGLYLTGVTATPPRADMEKTALGATLTMPWDYWENPIQAVNCLREQGLRIIALEQTADAIPYDRYRFEYPHCFIVGHEVKGVSPELLALADAAVDIPMAGRKQSLNVAISFGVLAYEIRRQWLIHDRQPTQVDPR